MSKSKQKSYGDAKVICPYYDSQETVQINCAPAVYDSSGLRVVFRSKVKKEDRKSTRLNSSHITRSRMPSSA